MSTKGKGKDTAGKSRLPCSDVHTALELYRRVAHWALLEGEPVTVPDISDAFSLTPRQAGDIMQFLHEENGETLRVEKRVVNRPRQGRRNALHVQAIDTDGFIRLLQAKESEVLARRRRREGLLGLRTWFVSRRHGEGIPAFLQVMLLTGTQETEAGAIAGDTGNGRSVCVSEN